jgi:hypothetical protein
VEGTHLFLARHIRRERLGSSEKRSMYQEPHGGRQGRPILAVTGPEHGPLQELCQLAHRPAESQDVTEATTNSEQWCAIQPLYLRSSALRASRSAGGTARGSWSTRPVRPGGRATSCSSFTDIRSHRSSSTRNTSRSSRGDLASEQAHKTGRLRTLPRPWRQGLTSVAGGKTVPRLRR